MSLYSQCDACWKDFKTKDLHSYTVNNRLLEEKRKILLCEDCLELC